MFFFSTNLIFFFCENSIPLVMEPRSGFYADPVLVLDFQSLYPSIMIAYNICYSTCLGELRGALDAERKFGIDELPLPPGLLAFLCANSDGDQESDDYNDDNNNNDNNDDDLDDKVSNRSKKSTSNKARSSASAFDALANATRHDDDSVAPFVAPNGVMFVRPSVRQGVLPRMLKEILETRVMVKAALKRAKANDDKAAVRLLDARQFGLKMIANVTYGYTSASATGRMPCSAVADSIVQTARETLERTIRTINNSGAKWDHAHVVYGGIQF